MRNPRRPLRVLISAGPTREPIDAVRFISNYSTGHMGARLAEAALARGHRVTVVSGPLEEALPRGARVIPVESSREMAGALSRHAAAADVIVMAAAVCDFRPMKVAAGKLGRRRTLTLRLRSTPDIIAGLPRRTSQLVAGFALETSHAPLRGRRKLRTKRLDVLVAQQTAGTGGPFGRRPVRAWLLTPHGRTQALGLRSKRAVARVLLDKLESLWYGQRRPSDRQN